MTSALQKPPKRRTSPKGVIRRLVEFKGMGRVSYDKYRDHVQELYDGPQGAVLFLGSVISLHEPLVGRLIRRRIFDTTRFRNILDIGSGAGQILRHLDKVCPADTSITGLDLSPQMLRRARARLKSKRLDYVAADMTQLPFADGSFDCITCGWVLEYLPDPLPGLREFARVLKPGGSLLLLVTEDTYLGAVVSRTWKCRTHNRKELRAVCETAGLPWHQEYWFTRFHKVLKWGGIIVEARKPLHPPAESKP